MTEEYVVVLGVAATRTIVLEMVVVIAVVMAMTRIPRTSESMDGFAASSFPSFLCLGDLVAIV